jgi:RNA polymerase sigma factor (sigma-70 family)
LIPKKGGLITHDGSSIDAILRRTDMIAAAATVRGLSFFHSLQPQGRQSRASMAETRSNATTSLELVIRANAGDDAAVAALYERYRPRLQRWAHNRLPPMARGALQTEDLVQDTLTHVLGHLTAFNPRHEGAFQGYVRTALKNRIRDVARYQKRRGSRDVLDSQILAEDASPLDIAVGQETLDRYDSALERLRPEDRDLIIGRIEMGLSYDEMRVMFERPSTAAVHMALSRALVKLAEEMAHERKR